MIDFSSTSLISRSLVSARHAEADGQACLPCSGDVEALHIRLPQPRSVEPRLERECQRNVEVMWLTGCLAPDFKTIADFRKDNGPAIRKVCREFIVVCGRAGLLTATTVAIDGSKFKAVNSRDRNSRKPRRPSGWSRSRRASSAICPSLKPPTASPPRPEIKRTRLKGKIDRLKQEIERVKAIEAQLASAEDTQISLTDPDARSMQGTGKATGTVG